MTATIKKLLNSQNLSLNDVATISNVPLTTLRSSITKPIEKWSIRVLNAFAKSLDTPAGDLLNMLEQKEYSLEIDNKNQTIQGVFIRDKFVFQEMRGVIEASHLEGFNPTAKDIEDIRNSVMNPDPQEVERIDKIWGGDNE